MSALSAGDKRYSEDTFLKFDLRFPAACVCLFLGSALSTYADALPDAPPVPSPPQNNGSQNGFQISGSERLRLEAWNWWPTDLADGDYRFLASVAKLRFDRKTSRDDFALELQHTTLIDTPRHAIAPSPQGALGMGATYFDASGNQTGSLFVKQAFFRLKDPSHPGHSLRVGRFEFSDGLENSVSDPTLNWIKQNRISQRLIGPSNFTHVGRSMNGIQADAVSPHVHATATAFVPSRGSFDLNGNDILSRIRVAYLNLAFPRPHQTHPGEARLFGAYFDDSRAETVKVDNRPSAARAADKKAIKIGTLGGHYLHVTPAGPGRVDLTAWGALQFGSWGEQKHGAHSYALEAGYQWHKAKGKPWVRIGYDVSSGDGNPANSQHGTYFPMLLTGRIYARDPFSTQSNLKDLFVQVMLQPDSRTTLRADLHHLRLAESNDLWYSGAGAYQNRNFGYGGRPSSGANSLATLVDLSVDYQLHKNTALTLYLSYARGGDVVRSLYKGRDSTYSYIEMVQKF